MRIKQKSIKKFMKMVPVACVIPTMNRRDELIKCINNWADVCTMPTVMVIVDDSPDRADRLTDSEIEYLTRGSVIRIVVLTDNPGTGVGPARYWGVEWVMKNTHLRYILNTEDDCMIHEECVERLVNVQYQDKRFAYVGTAGNYTSFWYKEWWDESVKFYANLGVIWSFTRDFITHAGNFDPELRLREDVEMGLRAYQFGYWAVAVHAPCTHRRSNAEFKPGDPPWMEACERIKSRYGDMITVNKRGSIIPRGLYPKKKFWIDRNTWKLRELTEAEIEFVDKCNEARLSENPCREIIV